MLIDDDKKYRQCVLRKDTESYVGTQVSYIPIKFAVVGNVVKLKDEHGNWSDGWKIVSAGEVTTNVPDSHKMIKEHRRRTGDSLPK